MKRNEFINKHSVDSDIFLKFKSIKRPLLIKTLNQMNTYTVAECLESILSIDKLIATVRSSNHEKSIKKTYISKFKKEKLKLKFLINIIYKKDKKNKKISEKLFGKPNKKTFQNICYRLEKLLINKIDEKDNLSKEEKDFLNLISKNSKKNKKRVKQKKFREISNFYKERIHNYGEIDDCRIYSPEEVKKIVDDAINKIDCKYHSKISNLNNFFIDLRKRTLYIPNVEITGSSLRKNLLHEVECHLRRRCNGKKNKLQIFSIGTSCYEFFEEGLAKFFEQIHKNKFYDYGGLEKYLSICIIYGFLDGEKKNKKEFKKIINTYYRLYFKYYRAIDNFESVASIKTKNITERLFRGFTGDTHGCCLTRDLIYRESNIVLWNTLSKEKFNLDFVMSGKFSLFKKDDLKLAEKYIKVD